MSELLPCGEWRTLQVSAPQEEASHLQKAVARTRARDAAVATAAKSVFLYAYNFRCPAACPNLDIVASIGKPVDDGGTFGSLPGGVVGWKFVASCYTRIAVRCSELELLPLKDLQETELECEGLDEVASVSGLVVSASEPQPHQKFAEDEAESNAKDDLVRRLVEALDNVQCPAACPNKSVEMRLAPIIVNCAVDENRRFVCTAQARWSGRIRCH